MTKLLHVARNSGRLLDMFAGIVFTQKGQPVDLNDPPALEAALVGETEVSVIDLTIDRTNVGPEGEWDVFTLTLFAFMWAINLSVFAAIVAMPAFVIYALTND